MVYRCKPVLIYKYCKKVQVGKLYMKHIFGI